MEGRLASWRRSSPIRPRDASIRDRSSSRRDSSARRESAASAASATLLRGFNASIACARNSSASFAFVSKSGLSSETFCGPGVELRSTRCILPSETRLSCSRGWRTRRTSRITGGGGVGCGDLKTCLKSLMVRILPRLSRKGHARFRRQTLICGRQYSRLGTGIRRSGAPGLSRTCTRPRSLPSGSRRPAGIST